MYGGIGSPPVPMRAASNNISELRVNIDEYPTTVGVVGQGCGPVCDDVGRTKLATVTSASVRRIAMLLQEEEEEGLDRLTMVAYCS